MDGGIKFDVSANTAKFEADMGRVKNSASTVATSIGKAFSGLGGLFAGGTLIAGINGILRKMDDVSDMARRFGTTSEDIQKVGNAAQIVGTDIDSVARAMNKAGVAANKAARDGGAMAEAFGRVNIDPAAFAAAGLADRVKMIAEAQRAANGDAQKMADIFEVVGVRAANINFADLATEMGNVNVASNATVEALAAANDELDKMKQSATILGAGLLKFFLVDPAQRIGSLIGGGGFKTIEELQQEKLRNDAELNLLKRGVSLPDNADERANLVAQEIKRMKEEAQAAKNAMRDFVDEAKEAPEAVSKTTSQLEEQTRLLQEAADKRRANYEMEVALTEARLSGNKALEESIRQQQDFNEVLQETGSFETAANVQAVRSAQRQAEDQPAAQESASFAATIDSLTKNQRVAQIRGEFLTRSAEERAQELAGQGRGRSAVNIMDRAQAQRDRIMQRANMRDILREQFSGATDMGQAYREHQRNTSLADRMTRAEFEKSIKDQAKTPEMREREEKKEKERRAGASGAQGKSPLENVASEILGEIKKRLPIVALGY